MLESNEIIERTVSFVMETLEGAEGGHDWWHIRRVWKNASLISQEEPVDELVVQLAALLHDIADPKFHGGDEEIGPTMARRFLESINIDREVIEHIESIIRHMSFKNSLEGPSFDSPEYRVVQDADRLDAIGAIGIARAFNYGGFKNRLLYDPTIPPNLHQSKSEYTRSKAPTINHFYEKLLLLKDKMKTVTGKRLAAERHEYMEGFLLQFYKEWGELSNE